MPGHPLYVFLLSGQATNAPVHAVHSVQTAYCAFGQQLLGGGEAKKLYTLEGKPPSAFVRPVVGEALSTLPDSVQKSWRG